MTPTHRRTAAVAIGFAFIFAATLTLMGQSYSAPRTPWGDPDLQGTYTNSNESGISMEKPAEFAGKRVEEVTPAQLADLIKTRRERQLKTAQTLAVPRRTIPAPDLRTGMRTTTRRTAARG